MKKDDRKLLLKDLSARFPYGVKVDYPLWHGADIEETFHDIDGSIKKVKDNLTIKSDVLDWNELPKPYLRKMSSMNESEIEEYIRLRFPDTIGVTRMRHVCGNSIMAIVETLTSKEDVRYWYNDMISADTIDFLLSHHLDWRGHIEMNLAIEAPENMYKIEKGGNNGK